MSTPDAGFALALAELALAELSRAYGDLVAGFVGDAALGDLAREQGLEAALTAPHLDALRKQNRELVTRADERAERTMRDLVAREFPDHGIAGEEYGFHEGGPWLWVFDPVDGTSVLVRTALAAAYGLPAPQAGFGVLVGLLHGDAAVLGVLAELEPAHAGTLTYAHRWVGEAGSLTLVDGTPAAAPEQKPLAEAVLACTVPEVMFGDAPGFAALRARVAAVNTDLNCVGYVRLLGGGVQIVVERDLTLPDVAALLPVLDGAGVTVTDHSGRPVRFDATARDGEYALLAAEAQLHAEALAMLGPAELGPPGAHPERTTHLGYVAKFGG